MEPAVAKAPLNQMCKMQDKSQWHHKGINISSNSHSNNNLIRIKIKVIEAVEVDKAEDKAFMAAMVVDNNSKDPILVSRNNNKLNMGNNNSLLSASRKTNSGKMPSRQILEAPLKLNLITKVTININRIKEAAIVVEAKEAVAIVVAKATLKAKTSAEAWEDQTRT